MSVHATAGEAKLSHRTEIDSTSLNQYLSLGGFVFIALSFLGFILVGYVCIYLGPQPVASEFLDKAPIYAFVYAYLQHLLLLVGSIISAMFGVRLLRSAGSAYIRVIPPDDFPVLAAMFDKTSFLDLAKLTLGAFIGSFVQKHQIERGTTTPGVPKEEHKHRS